MITEFDYAIAGSTPLSGMLAGLLAQTHGAKVCRIGDFLHELRPQRGFDISTGPITRPDTWNLLRKTIPETIKLLNGVAKSNLFERVDCMLLSLDGAGADGLAYMSDVAHGYNFQVERLSLSEQYIAAYAHRNCFRVLRRPLTAALPIWLEKLGVTMLSTENIEIKSPQKGGVKISQGGQEFSAKKLILAGDAAIAAFGNQRDMKAHFHALSMSALLMQPTGKLPAPIVQAVDAGLTIYQRNTGALDCAGLGNVEEVGQVARTYLGPKETVRLAGSAVFNSLLTRDGGPVLGSISRKDTVYLGGLGVTGLFQAPAIARFLAGRSDTFEQEYFAARAPATKGKARSAAEFMPSRLLRAVA